MVTDEEIAQIRREQLDNLRQRLLDLTTRNRLLSTKFSNASRREVRLVDELPDHLCNTLQEGGGMTFVSLPELSRRPKDEDNSSFKSEFERLRLSDEEYLDKRCELDESNADALE